MHNASLFIIYYSYVIFQNITFNKIQNIENLEMIQLINSNFTIDLFNFINSVNIFITISSFSIKITNFTCENSTIDQQGFILDSYNEILIENFFFNNITVNTVIFTILNSNSTTLTKKCIQLYKIPIFFKAI